jgi:S-adenosylmethionine:tRNA ribosyltransferase-isomerase
MKHNWLQAARSIVKHPVENRDESRLMVFTHKKTEIEHKMFKDIMEYSRACLCDE